MRSLMEILRDENNLVENLIENDRDAQRTTKRLDEAENSPFECTAKIVDIERYSRELDELSHMREAYEKSLRDIRLEIRDYFQELMSMEASRN